MTCARWVATEEKCDVTPQKSSASLQNSGEASEGRLFHVKAGTLYSETSLLSITQTAFENWEVGVGRGGGVSAVSFRPETSWKLARSTERWKRMLTIKQTHKGHSLQAAPRELFILTYFDTLTVCNYCRAIFFFLSTLSVCYFKLVNDSILLCELWTETSPPVSAVPRQAEAFFMRCSVLPCLGYFRMNKWSICIIVLLGLINDCWYQLLPLENGVDSRENWCIQCSFYLFVQVHRNISVFHCCWIRIMK